MLKSGNAIGIILFRLNLHGAEAHCATGDAVRISPAQSPNPVCGIMGLVNDELKKCKPCTLKNHKTPV